MTSDTSADSSNSNSSPPVSGSSEDIVVSPLALVGVGALIRAARRRERAPLVLGITAMAVEFGLPAYDRYKRNSVVPTVVRVVRTP